MSQFWGKILSFMVIIGVASITNAYRVRAVAKKGTAVYGEIGRLEAYDPYTVHEASAQRLSDLLFDSLIDVSSGGTYEPNLATGWKIRKGGTEVELELRQNVYFNDPQNKVMFTAQDVVTTIRLLTARESEIPNRERFADLRSAQAKGSHRVVVYFSRALADPLRSLLFKVLPHYKLAHLSALKRDDSFVQHPIGTGAYRFVSANKQGEILLEANEKYFKGIPQIKRLVMKSFVDQSVMAQSLMYNSLDLVTYVSPRDLTEVMGDKRMHVVPYDALSFTFFAMNTSRGLLRDKKVRQAISQSVNVDEMLKAFFQNKGRRISGPFPPTSWAYNLKVKPLAYDPQEAKRLLVQSGLKYEQGKLVDQTGRPVKLNFAVPLTGESETVRRIVLAFQSYLEAIGITVDLQFMDWLVWKRKVLGVHDYDMTIASWSFDDASNITSLFHSASAKPWGNNFVLYRNDQVDSLLTEADASNDFDKKRMIYHKLHAILAEEAPYIYLWTLMNHAAHNKRLSSVRVEPYAFFKHALSWQLKD